MAGDIAAQSDVGVAFSVLYNAHPGKAVLRVIEQTQAATLYGVYYQVGVEYSDKNRRLSGPLTLEDVRMTDVEADLLNGEKLLIRMVDNNQ